MLIGGNLMHTSQSQELVRATSSKYKLTLGVFASTTPGTNAQIKHAYNSTNNAVLKKLNNFIHKQL